MAEAGCCRSRQWLAPSSPEGISLLDPPRRTPCSALWWPDRRWVPPRWLLGALHRWAHELASAPDARQQPRRSSWSRGSGNRPGMRRYLWGLYPTPLGGRVRRRHVRAGGACGRSWEEFARSGMPWSASSYGVGPDPGACHPSCKKSIGHSLRSLPGLVWRLESEHGRRCRSHRRPPVGAAKNVHPRIWSYVAVLVCTTSHVLVPYREFASLHEYGEPP